MVKNLYDTYVVPRNISLVALRHFSKSDKRIRQSLLAAAMKDIQMLVIYIQKLDILFISNVSYKHYLAVLTFLSFHPTTILPN